MSTVVVPAPHAATPAGVAFRLDAVALLPPEAFRSACLHHIHDGARVSALFAHPSGEGFELLAVLARDAEGELVLLRTPVEEGAFPALSARAPQAQAFEREIAELHHLEPEGHPWLKPLRRHAELDPDAPPHPFFQAQGAGLHEVAVGPVHAGVIEPGHFRFQCRGEEVLHLEIQLGYQTRGAEARLLAGTPAQRLAVAETLAGDTTVGHALAHCQALEALAGAEVPKRAEALRGIALELERLANHAGDLGALCNDVGFLPGSACFGRLRGEFLSMTLELCGNRYGRGLLVPGGVRFDLALDKAAVLVERLAAAMRDCRDTAELVFDTPSVIARFEGTGALTREMADELGLVGPVARACGCPRDVRANHPRGVYREARIEAATAETGDVLARAKVRWAEMERSAAFVERQLFGLPEGPIRTELGGFLPGLVACGMTEAWRGEVVHVVATGPDAAIITYKVIDPSFHNWFGLAMALRGNAISDFPLCNKSFNLSYCGHDL